MTLSFDLEGRALEGRSGPRRAGRVRRLCCTASPPLAVNNPDLPTWRWNCAAIPPGQWHARDFRSTWNTCSITIPLRSSAFWYVLVQRIRDIGPSHGACSSRSPIRWRTAPREACISRTGTCRDSRRPFQRVAWQLRTAPGGTFLRGFRCWDGSCPIAALQSQLQLAAGDPADVPRLDPA